MITSLEVRQELVNALKLDLVGPWPGHELAEERLSSKTWPSYWYLTGFLIPTGAPPEQSSDYDGDDDLSEAPHTSGVPGESTEEEKAAKKSFFPSSIGISFLVSQIPQILQVAIRWGDYHLIEEQVENSNISYWQRQAREEFIRLDMPLQTEATTVYDLPNAAGLQLHVAQRLIRDGDFTTHIPSGTRSISIFLVNHRPPQSSDLRNQAFVFQPEIEISSEQAFVPRPDPRGVLAEDWDEQVADLHYADTPEFATGHGVSAEWDLLNGQCHVLRTAWIPAAEVEKMETIAIPDVELKMDKLGVLTDGSALKIALMPMVTQYKEWLKEQGKQLSDLSHKRQEIARELLRQADLAAWRIEQGIEILSQDADALDAFRVANRAVSRALKKRLNLPNPSWRAFQLAFILLNLKGMVEPSDPHRETVDLLFFPTGGGKTEAYLGLAAFAMVLRRLKHPQDQGYCGAGVSVIMRYTLRLLTLDQLGRAAGLTCALELERQNNLKCYGHWPFEIGLWVGKAATPNILGKKGDSNPDSARTKVRQYKRDSQGKPSPIPLENCPWCGERFEPDSFTLLPNDDLPTELRIVCANFECDFSGDRPLPILAVDEGIYRRLPAFLISTVDKFASLPWIAQSGVLLGGAERYSEKGFYGAAETGQGKRLTEALQPPDLIIQDELHLISGPLGTMAGLYEAAIEALSLTEYQGQKVRPKIVASTATVRRAQEQIQALFGRALTQIFPPPGPDRKDAFFAKTAPSKEIPARLYVGVAAQGRNPKEVMRRVWLVLMGAAQSAYQAAGGKSNPDNPADPYMTVLGYFNSLRELGGARRILEEQVQNTIKGYSARKRLGEQTGLFSDRHNFSEVLELTSRVSTNKVAEARRRLESLFNPNQGVDCAIATNMISVGLDIPRLGLMVVFAQPKTHAEYIQATSRVGRDSERPGLVVTLLNIHRPRDRSHYERFKHYHETFYRSVEAGSVTPFSARALDRGMAGAMVALARHIENPLTPAKGVSNITQVRNELEHRLLQAFYERVNAQPMDDPNERAERLRSVQNRIIDLLDSWAKIVQNYYNQGITMTYQEYEEPRNAKPLLRGMLETDFETEDHRKFRANRSLRDVEPEVNVFIKDLNGMQLEEAQ